MIQRRIRKRHPKLEEKIDPLLPPFLRAPLMPLGGSVCTHVKVRIVSQNLTTQHARTASVAWIYCSETCIGEYWQHCRSDCKHSNNQCSSGIEEVPNIQNHLEERLLDQAQARAAYTPLFWGHSRSIPQGMILDVQPLVKSLFCPIRPSPNGFFDSEASIA